MFTTNSYCALTSDLDDFGAHQSATTSVSLSGNILVSGSQDKSVKVWTLRQSSAALLTSMSTKSPISSVSIDCSRQFVVSGCSSGSIKLWDLESQKMVRSFIVHREPVSLVRFHPQCDVFATTCAGETRVWDLRKRSATSVFYLNSQKMDFSPDGRWLLSSNDKTATLLDISSSGIVSEFNHPTKIKQVCFHPTQLVAGVLCDSLHFWDMKSLSTIKVTNGDIDHFLFDKSIAKDSCLLVQKSKLSMIKWQDNHTESVTRLEWPSLFDATMVDYKIHNGMLLGAAANGLFISAFLCTLPSLPKLPRSSSLVSSGSSTPRGLEIIEIDGHCKFMATLTARLQILRRIRSKWQRPVEALKLAKDHTVYMDLLEVVYHSKSLNLDICLLALGWIAELMFYQEDVYIERACKVLKLLLNSFQDLIKQTLEANEVGVDLKHEERAEKCRLCRDLLQDIKFMLNELNSKVAKDVLIEFK